MGKDGKLNGKVFSSTEFVEICITNAQRVSSSMCDVYMCKKEVGRKLGAV